MYVAEIIKGDYKKWNIGEVIVIFAQTGAGKTYFVLNRLLPYASLQGKRLLYLSNRSALKAQVELSYPKEFKNNIIPMNYQEFELTDLTRHELSETGKDILSCEYWVMDEAHYFLSDGSFNSNVSKCLGNVASMKKSRILIFMTATPKYLFLALGTYNFFSQKPDIPIQAAVGNYSKFLHQISSPANLLKFKEIDDTTYFGYNEYLDLESRLDSLPSPDYAWPWIDQYTYYSNYKDVIPKIKFQKKFQDYLGYIKLVSKEVLFYQAHTDYGYVHPVYFRTLIQLCDRIVSTPKHEKWLIFVSSKTKGQDIRDYLVEKGVDSVLITSGTKRRKKRLDGLPLIEYEVYKSIIEESKSPVRVTIATSVLDNGVNIKDPDLKHLAILEMNPTTFLQMIGRKRLESPKEQINLYLQSKDTGEIKAYFERSVLQYVRFLVELQTVNTDADRAKCLNDMQVVFKLEKFQNEYQINGQFRPNFVNYVSKKYFRSTELMKDFINGPYPCRLFEPNPVTSIRLMYDYYRILALLESYENLPEEQKRAKKETLWEEHQLSWMELDYNPVCWIDYEQHLAAKKELEIILSEYEGDALPKQVQEQLKKVIITVANTSHPPMDVEIRQASLSKVNEALAELQLPQRIKSKNCSIKGKQRNYWFVTHNNEQK